jgi:hypothetical protein
MYTRFTTVKPAFIFLAEVMVWGVMCTLPIYFTIVLLASTGLYYVPIPLHMWAPVVFMVVMIVLGRLEHIHYKTPHPDQTDILADYFDVLEKNRSAVVIDDMWLFSERDIKHSLLNALYQAKTNPYYGDALGPSPKQLTHMYLDLAKFQPDVEDNSNAKSLGTCGGPNISEAQSASLARGANANSCGPSGCSTESPTSSDNVTILRPQSGSNSDWARKIAKDHRALSEELKAKGLFFF